MAVNYREEAATWGHTTTVAIDRYVAKRVAGGTIAEANNAAKEAQNKPTMDEVKRKRTRKAWDKS